MRLFIGADINSRSKELIENRLSNLKSELDNKINWVEKDNWHLTLKFLGESTVKEKDKLIDILKETDFCGENKYLQFSRLDAFPDKDAAKIIYLGLSRGKNILIDLHQNLENKLSKNGFQKDVREYKPHLTLGRNKGKPFKLKKELGQQYLINIYARLESVNLYQSKLKADGPEYIKLFSIK